MKKDKKKVKNIDKKLEKEFYVDQLNSDLDYKEFGNLNKTIHSKQDYEYFIEESYIPHPLLHVKRITKTNSEKWKISLDENNSLIIDGSLLTERECMFLRTVEGFDFLISIFKDGVKQLSTIRQKLSLILPS